MVGFAFNFIEKVFFWNTLVVILKSSQLPILRLTFLVLSYIFQYIGKGRIFFRLDRRAFRTHVYPHYFVNFSLWSWGVPPCSQKKTHNSIWQLPQGIELVDLVEQKLHLDLKSLLFHESSGDIILFLCFSSTWLWKFYAWISA